ACRSTRRLLRRSSRVHLGSHALRVSWRRRKRHRKRRLSVDPPPDDRDFHPFTPVSVTPSTNAFCARKNRTITGAITSSVAAIVRFHCTWCSDRNCARPIGIVQWSGESIVYRSGRKKSLNV